MRPFPASGAPNSCAGAKIRRFLAGTKIRRSPRRLPVEEIRSGKARITAATVKYNSDGLGTQ